MEANLAAQALHATRFAIVAVGHFQTPGTTGEGCLGRAGVSGTRAVSPRCDCGGVPASVASRARADLLRDRIAMIRAEHSQATARARADGTELAPYPHLGALGLADHFPAMVAAQAVNRHLLAAFGDLLLVEQEQQRAATT